MEPDDDLELEEIDENPDLVEDDDDLPIEEDNPDEPELEPEKRQLTRPQREIIKLRKRAQDAEDRARRAEETGFRNSGAIDALSRQQTQGQSAEQQRLERERYELMSPDEKVEYRLNQERSQISSAFAQQGFQTADTIDAMRFERLCEKNPAYAGVADEVDKRLGEMRKGGSNVERKILAHAIIGERAAQKVYKTQVRTRERVEEDTRRQRSRPSGGGSDVSEVRSGRKGKSPAERLANVKF